MTDLITRAIKDLKRVEPTTSWNDVLRRADGISHGETEDPEDRSALGVLGDGGTARRRTRVWLAVAASIAAIALGTGVLWSQSDTPVKVTTGSSPSAAQPTQPAPPPTSAPPDSRTTTTLAAVGSTWNATVSVWSGREYMVWSGQVGPDGTERADGWRYDPVAKSTRPIPQAPIAPRNSAAGVWTGQKLIVCCGNRVNFDDPSYDTASAAAYDPQTDTWRVLAQPPPQTANYTIGTAWTGTEMLVLTQTGAPGAELTGDIGRAMYSYDPATDVWTERSAPPIGDRFAETTWTGKQLVLWVSGSGSGAGALYDPASDSWAELPTQPSERPVNYGSVAFADGQIVVWGGDGSDDSRTVGYRIRPGEDNWRPMAPAPLPPIDAFEGTYGSQSMAVDSASQRIVVWPVTGSESGAGGAIDGTSASPPHLWTYDPAEDTWTRVAQLGDAWYSPELTVGNGMVFMPQADAPLIATISD